jgi:hypothetical protein
VQTNSWLCRCGCRSAVVWVRCRSCGVPRLPPPRTLGEPWWKTRVNTSIAYDIKRAVLLNLLILFAILVTCLAVTALGRSPGPAGEAAARPASIWDGSAGY